MYVSHIHSISTIISLTKDSCYRDFFSSKCIQAISKTTCFAKWQSKYYLNILMSPNCNEMPTEQLLLAPHTLVTTSTASSQCPLEVSPGLVGGKNTSIPLVGFGGILGNGLESMRKIWCLGTHRHLHPTGCMGTTAFLVSIVNKMKKSILKFAAFLEC